MEAGRGWYVMPYITSGNDAVDSMGRINISGNIIPQVWYKTVTKENGKPHLLAITLLADIVYWYRPSEVREEGTGQVTGWKKRFKGDMLQKTYQQYSDLFGESKRSIKAAFDMLEGLGVIKRVFRNVTCQSGLVLNNVMFVGLDTDILYKLTYPGGRPEDRDKCKGGTGKGNTVVDGGVTECAESISKPFKDIQDNKNGSTKIQENNVNKSGTVQKDETVSGMGNNIKEYATLPQKNVPAPIKDNNTYKKTTYAGNNNKDTRKSGLDGKDNVDRTEIYRKIIKHNIDYETIKYDLKNDTGYLDELLDIIVGIVSFDRESIRVSGTEHPYQEVKSRMLKLDSFHIRYVMDCMQKNTKKIMNIKAYLVAALYNAPYTIKHYYQSVVNHDLYGAGG